MSGLDRPVTTAGKREPIVQIELEALRKKKLFVATPCFGGVTHSGYARSLFRLGQLCAMHRLPISDPLFLPNESLIARARNYCAHMFLQSDATHFMFIDADIEFDPRDVLSLMSLCDEETDKDIVCGVYPKKHIAWDKIQLAAAAGKAKDEPAALAQYGSDYAVGFADNGTYKLSELIPVREGGTGFMMIKRSVFDKFAAAYPEMKYKPDHRGLPGLRESGTITAFFLDLIDDGRHLSEDYMFCQWARKIGLHVWVAPWMRLVHHGAYAYQGNLPAVAELTAKGGT